MTTMAGTGGGGALVATLAGGVVLVGALLASQVGTALDATLEAQPVPAPPTVAVPPPQAQAVNWGGPSTLALGFGTVIHAATLTLPEGAVQTGTHAEERHTEQEANEVRQAVAAAIAANPVLGGQPPCKDGRHRFIVPMGKAWGVWVLQRVADGLYQEVTAFRTTNQGYVKGISDDCGNGGWFGHAYAQ